MLNGSDQVTDVATTGAFTKEAQKKARVKPPWLIKHVHTKAEPGWEEWNAVTEQMASHPIYTLHELMLTIAKVGAAAYDFGTADAAHRLLKEIYKEDAASGRILRNELLKCCYEKRSKDEDAYDEYFQPWLFIIDSLTKTPITTLTHLITTINKLGDEAGDHSSIGIAKDNFLKTLHFEVWLTDQERQTIRDLLIEKVKSQ